MNQIPLRERVANERRRLKSVRQAMSAALERGSGNDPAWAPFYIAVADYIDAAMHRLHIQDVRMGEMIRAKLGDKLDERARQGLQELDERLDGNQRHLQAFLECRDRLRNEGAQWLAEFERIGRDYTGYITANMGHHGAITDLAQSLFSLDDWAYMAGVSDDEARQEQALYTKVFAAAPAVLALRPAS